MPYSDYWFCIIWADSRSPETDEYYSRVVYASPANANELWKLNVTNATQSSWIKLATATKPQEFDLPLASGFTNADVGIKSRYSKDQMGQVFVDLAVSGSIDANTITTIATLPEGFRPSYIAHSVAYRYTGQLPSIGLWVSVDGTVSCFSPENIEGLAGQILFIAAG